MVLLLSCSYYLAMGILKHENVNNMVGKTDNMDSDGRSTVLHVTCTGAETCGYQKK
jgi:hypothetical protein